MNPKIKFAAGFSLSLLIGLIFLFNSNITYAAVCPSGKSYCWYRGSTHNHLKGGDPTTYRDWYIAAGYDFLVGWNHDYDGLGTCAQQETAFSLSPNFLGLCGGELSINEGHMTALGLNSIPTGYSSLQDAVTKTNSAGGVGIKNHPIDDGSSASLLIGTVGLNHFELANGGRMDQVPAAETLWDSILTTLSGSTSYNGRKFYAVGSDDNHYDQGSVGTAWVMVKANSLTKGEIVNNFRSGNFYTSSGVFLADYNVDNAARTINIDSRYGASSAWGTSITFIGKNGTVLKTVTGSVGSYTFNNSESYVRAKVVNSSGEAAWTQPVYLSDFSGGGSTPPPAVSPSPRSSPSPTPRVTPRPTPRSTPTPTASPTITRNGDADGNGIVNTTDVTYILQRWVQNLTTTVDQYIDSKINSLDFAVVRRYL